MLLGAHLLDGPPGLLGDVRRIDRLGGGVGEGAATGCSTSTCGRGAPNAGLRDVTPNITAVAAVIVILL
ncbi:hypothetical protein [Clavibacter tessellarius]|uniref:hypothetical protein n=1 Tax=Clavibacter tessellarius TaxID=31965 RepID=UPI0032450F9B